MAKLKNKILLVWTRNTAKHTIVSHAEAMAAKCDCGHRPWNGDLWCGHRGQDTHMAGQRDPDSVSEARVSGDSAAGEWRMRRGCSEPLPAAVGNGPLPVSMWEEWSENTGQAAHWLAAGSLCTSVGQELLNFCGEQRLRSAHWAKIKQPQTCQVCGTERERDQ